MFRKYSIIFSAWDHFSSHLVSFTFADFLIVFFLLSMENDSTLKLLKESNKSIISSVKSKPLQIKLHSCLLAVSVKTFLKFLRIKGSPPVRETLEFSGNSFISLIQASESKAFFCLVLMKIFYQADFSTLLSFHKLYFKQ